jgi:hypothetical protein
MLPGLVVSKVIPKHQDQEGSGEKKPKGYELSQPWHDPESNGVYKFVAHAIMRCRCIPMPPGPSELCGHFDLGADLWHLTFKKA